MGEAKRRAAIDGSTDTNTTVVSWWISETANLFRLDDGRFWLDDVWNDRQGFIDGECGAMLAKHLHPHPDHQPEPFGRLLADYAVSRAGQPLTDALPMPWRVHIDPETEALLMPPEGKAGIAGELAAACRTMDDQEYGRRKVTATEYTAALDRLRQIGQQQNAQGGYDAMLGLAKVASVYYPNTGNTLNVHWDGIGVWQR